MKTLVVHPDDRSTDFLRAVYAGLDNLTVITGGMSVAEVHQQIKEHDRVIMLGHGTPRGLLAIGNFSPNPSEKVKGVYQFPPFLVVDESIAEELAKKENNIYIWCYASDFVKAHDLKGFCSGMFISEVLEAEMMGVHNQSQEAVDAQCKYFCDLVGSVAHKPANEIYDYVHAEYGKWVNKCPITKYNHERLYVGM
jgi:hypothetical protein